VKTKFFLSFLAATFALAISCGEAGTGAVRTMPATFVPGGSLQVSISVSTDATNPPPAVIINETLPEGWVISKSSPGYIKVIGSTYTWLFYSNTGVPSSSISYTVQIPSSASGTYQFTGTLTTSTEGKQSITGTQMTTEVNTVIQPVLTPGTGIYYNPISVTITCDTPGATIRYTLNGSEPDSSFPVYATPIPITTTTTVKAKAYKDGLKPSSTATATYKIENLLGSVSGIIAYEGKQTGIVHVHLYTSNSYPGQPAYTQALAGPGAYQFTSVKPQTYYLWAFLDGNGDGLFDALTEPAGDYPDPIQVQSGKANSNINFSLFEPAVKKGDINFDRKITITDEINCLRMISKLSVRTGEVTYDWPYPEILLTVADTNNDQKIDLFDVIWILKFLLGNK